MLSSTVALYHVDWCCKNPQHVCRHWCHAIMQFLLTGNLFASVSVMPTPRPTTFQGCLIFACPMTASNSHYTLFSSNRPLTMKQVTLTLSASKRKDAAAGQRCWERLRCCTDCLRFPRHQEMKRKKNSKPTYGQPGPWIKR